MPSNTWATKWQALNHTPLQEISTSPNPNDIVIITSPEPTPEPTTKALIKRTGNCPLCRLPYVYDHITWCQGLTNGYTCHCHRETLTQEQTPSKTKHPYLPPLSNNWTNSTLLPLIPNQSYTWTLIHYLWLCIPFPPISQTPNSNDRRTSLLSLDHGWDSYYCSWSCTPNNVQRASRQ